MKITYIISDIDKALAFEWIASGLDKKKFDLSFILILQKEADLQKWLQFNQIRCQSFYYTSKKQLPSILYEVYRVLKKEKPDVVHCHLLYGSVIGLTAAKLAGINKRIYTRHHSDYHHRYFPKGIKWDKWCNRLATKIVAPSQAVKEVLMQYEDVAGNKISIIHHGFQLDYFSIKDEDRTNALRTKYNVSGHFPVVGVIARFTELKGIQYIIPAFQKLLHNFPNALLLLFNARGDYEEKIKQQLFDLVPENNYRLIPFENDLASVYGLLDVFVQVSTDKNIEAFGQTYVEALAAGVPSIFTLSGIASDFVVNEVNALVVPYKDSEAIYEKLIRLSSDEELQRTLSANGKSSVANDFALSKMISALEDLYEQ